MAPKTQNKTKPWSYWRRASSKAADRLVAEALESLHEHRKQKARDRLAEVRRKRGKGAIKQRSTVEALLLDPLIHESFGPSAPLIIRLDNNWLSKGSSGAIARNRTVRPLVDDLHALGWLKVDKAFKFNGKVMTRLQTGRRLLEAAKRLDVGPEHVSEDISAISPVVLRSKRAANGKRTELNYRPSNSTRRLEEQVQRLNSYFAEADLSSAASSASFDLTSRAVRRVFNDGSFKSMGRLAGSAFWLNLDKDVREEELLICSRSIGTADISSAIPRIAYALERLTPVGDPYRLKRMPDAPRDAVKIAFQQLLWGKYTLASRLASQARSEMPNEYTAKAVFDEIITENAEIKEYLGALKPWGGRLLWHESEIIIDATLRAYERGLTVLPLHDALLAPDDQIDDAAAVLEEAFVNRFGVAPEITLE